MLSQWGILVIFSLDFLEIGSFNFLQNFWACISGRRLAMGTRRYPRKTSRFPQ